MTGGRDPELTAFLADWPSRPLAQARDLAAARTISEEESSRIPLPLGCSVEPIDSPGVTGELIRPAVPARDGAILFHHGGGHVFGSPAEHRHLAARIGAAAQLPVYNLAYPLAPEHPYPRGPEQGLANYRFVLDQGVSPDRLIVAGDSAGGNLSVAMLLRAQARQMPMPAGVYLISPWLDLGGVPKGHDLSRDPMLNPAAILAWAAWYRGAHDPAEPDISPVHAPLETFPPTLIQVGGAELLLKNSLDFAHKLAAKGLDVQLSVAKDQVHDWPLFHMDLPRASAAAFSEWAEWAARRLPG